MAKDPGIGKKVVATVTGVRGHCDAGHQVGETFERRIIRYMHRRGKVDSGSTYCFEYLKGARDLD